MPTVNPPPRFAPFADASMTPFRPPHTRMASARAMRNPTSSARAIPSREAVLPPRITPTIGFRAIRESPFTRTLALRLCRNGFKGENEPLGGARGAPKLGIALMPVHRFALREIMARDPTCRYFAGTDRDRAAFEVGIKLGSILHQYVGTPVTHKNAAALEKAIEVSTQLQPLMERVRVKIDRKRMRI